MELLADVRQDAIRARAMKLEERRATSGDEQYTPDITIRNRSLADPETRGGVALTRGSPRDRLVHRAARSKVLGRMLAGTAEQELAGLSNSEERLSDDPQVVGACRGARAVSERSDRACRSDGEAT